MILNGTHWTHSLLRSNVFHNSIPPWLIGLEKEDDLGAGQYLSSQTNDNITSKSSTTVDEKLSLVVLNASWYINNSKETCHKIDMDDLKWLKNLNLIHASHVVGNLKESSYFCSLFWYKCQAAFWYLFPRDVDWW